LEKGAAHEPGASPTFLFRNATSRSKVAVEERVVTVDEFVEKWKLSGGNERANTQLFITDLCAILGVGAPQPTTSDTTHNDYVFERHVVKTETDGTNSNGWIDCYKRDSFILEAKQGSEADQKAVDAGQGDSLRDFFGQTASERFKRGMAKRGTGQWTGAMQRAAGQAEGYAKALPPDHGWPLFLLVTDVGHCIDVYADFARSGKGYAPFPDRRRFRITLDDLRDEKVRKRLAAIWDAPLSLDPSAEAARVTREIAGHLATLARRIEAREQNPDRTAAFLMRLLFTMFAEDTGLIPKKSFRDLLKKVRDRPENLPPMLADLWAKMDTGGFVGALGEAGETVRQFNGYLFKDTTAIALDVEEIDVLIAAATADWQQVEPAIFGTLLERALDPKERAKLGAHYTPRAYVERLVGPTIMEPLREDWAGARTAATQAAEAGDKESARQIVETFHGKLARTKVLDPACGTGNFLYVSMARMKELEGEVLELLEELGDDQYLAEISGHTITPENFLGIEINPRAANIAQLVLWIGYLQWHFRVNGEDRMPEAPVLRDVKTIENRDALITWDKRELERDQYGRPVTRWDGETMKKHPVTGKDVPDETARAEVYRYVNPKPAKWQKADFIIGNPPFIGNKRMRDRLGGSYVDALRRVFRDVPSSVDFVMYWWDRAATLVRKNVSRQFGLVTTNTIVQSQARPVLRRAMGEPYPLRIAFAVADHPWRDVETDAAVRVSMTVGARDVAAGRLGIVEAAGGNEAGASVSIRELRGQIGPDLQLGNSPSAAVTLKANARLCWQGVKLVGSGFIVQGGDFTRLAAREPDCVFLRRYWTGRDFTQAPVVKHVIDFTGLGEVEARNQAPSLFAHLVDHVHPVRAENNDRGFREKWWLFGRPRPELREANEELDRYIVTSEVAKHRFFQFLAWPENLVDGSVIAISLPDSFYLGILSSRIHVAWALAAGGRMGVGNDPRYQNEVCFDPFPFPDTSDEALKDRIRDAAEKLDALRKDVLARHEDLTLTKLYNVLEALRAADKAGTVLSDKDRDIATRGCVSLIRQYHDTIDAAVAEAYGWPADLSDEEILERLVALNKERAAEEAKGIVRWLRPDFQAPGYSAPKTQETLALPETAAASADILEWPTALPDQFTAVAAVVDRAARPIAANDVARAFRGKNAKGVAPVLDTLAGMGRLRKLEDGRYAA
jgi:hypothetical protein